MVSVQADVALAAALCGLAHVSDKGCSCTTAPAWKAMSLPPPSPPLVWPRVEPEPSLGDEPATCSVIPAARAAWTTLDASCSAERLRLERGR